MLQGTEDVNTNFKIIPYHYELKFWEKKTTKSYYCLNYFHEKVNIAIMKLELVHLYDNRFN